MMKILTAEPQNVDKILPLYMGYLDFYHVEKDESQAREYLTERLTLGQSRIFYLEEDGQAMGFTQLYPLFYSLEMKRIWLVYDLYVAPQARQKGVAQRLLNRAEQLARETDSAFMMLSTATDNVNAQALYEKNQFVRDNDFFVYNKFLD